MKHSIKKWRVAATVEMQCVLVVEADSIEEAEEVAGERGFEEWLYSGDPQAENVSVDWVEQL